MLNYIWSFLVAIGIIYAALTGNIEALNESILSSSKDAIDLLILMAGVVAMWNGFLTIAEESGLTKSLARKMKPFLHLFFPDIPKDHIANDYICANFIANILGLGWACTPTGLNAMKALKQLEQERITNPKTPHTINNCNLSLHEQNNEINVASDEMCTFLILNISSLQIIPMNMIAYRSQYGSPNPMAVIAPGLITTIITTMLAAIICRIMCRKTIK
jgi:spore maturation protein A